MFLKEFLKTVNFEKNLLSSMQSIKGALIEACLIKGPNIIITCTVKPVLSCNSKIDSGSLMKEILQYF